MSLFLAACGTKSTLLVDRPDLAKIDPVILEECPNLAELPERDLTLEDVKYWIGDRYQYKRCADSKSILIEAVLTLYEQTRDRQEKKNYDTLIEYFQDQDRLNWGR